MMRDQELAGLAMTLSRDAKIKITVGGDGSYCKPDGSHINIARMPSTPLGRMLMTGLVFHEIGHKNYTKGGKPDGLLGDMMNVIEDIRVDMETIKKRPGTCFNLEAVTSHYVNKGSLKPTNLAHALLGKVMAFGFGRLLMHKSILPLEIQCNEMMDDAFGSDFVDDVNVIIKDIPKLRSTSDTSIMAKKLIDLLIQQQTLPPTAQKQQTRVQGQAQNGGLGSSDSASPGKQEQPSQDLDINASGSGSNGTGAGGGKRPTPEEIAEMLKNKTGYGDLSALIQSELDNLALSTNSHERLGIPMLPDIGRLKAFHGKLDEVEAISAVSRMRARMMGLLQSIKNKPKSFGLSGRKLANGRLVKLALGDPRIFRKKIEAKVVNTAVVVLLDLSGSMTSKYEIANAAAFALHSTLFGLKGVAICSLEFSGKDEEPDVNLLVDFGVKPKSENFNHLPFDGTPTDTAIWTARAKLLQRLEPRKIMLILTDGCPDNGTETRAATVRTMKDGIEIAAIGIKDTSARNFWDNHKIIESIQELPAAMFGIMEGLLIKANHSCQLSSFPERSNP
jgi:cobaltochelatase CobT